MTYESLSIREKDKHKYVKLFIVDSPESTEYDPYLWFLDLEVNNKYIADPEYIERLDIFDFLLA